MPQVTEPTRHCVLVGLMGAGKSTVGVSLARRLDRPFRDSDADIQAATGLTVRELLDRDGVDAMHALEAGQLLDSLADPMPSVIAAAASVVDVPACVQALGSPDVFVIWLRASPDVLAARFDSADDHRPAYGERPATFLSEQFDARATALGAVADLIVDADSSTADEVVTRVMEALR
jgi:shikimate kinase